MTGHCKNLSDLTHKICSQILQKVRPVTSITNIFLKPSEGQLFISVNQCLRHNLGYKQKIIQFIRRNQVYFRSSNVSTDTTDIS